MTSPGIGASGVMGVAFEDLNETVLATPTTATTGGTITAGTYRYVVTALNANGESMGSNEVSVTTTGSTSTVTLNWTVITGATGYNIYKTTAGGASGTELKSATVGAVLTFIDTAPGAPSGALPTTNTATTPGVYVPPTKFIPFLNENLTYTQDTQWRRPIRNTPGLVGAVAGNSSAAGDIVLEMLSDTCLYFLDVSRCTRTKTGTGPFTYTYTPAPNAIPAKTLSVTIVRNGQVFGYTGVTTGQIKISIESGLLQFTASVIAFDEASQAALTGIAWPTTTPFGAGSYSLQIPTATQIFDTDTFEFTSNDNANPAYRFKNTGRGASFIYFGESDGDIKVERDFLTRADYDAFKALTAQSITLAASKGAGESVTILAPVGIKDTYEVGLSAQGDLVRAQIAYQLAIDGTGKHYQITVVTPTENV